MSADWEVKPLSDICVFMNGLWKGKKPPFIEVGVIRNTNFTKDCKLDDSDIAYLQVEQSQFAKRALRYGDIILEKSGGGPNQPVGRVVIFDKSEGDFSFSNFTSAIRVKDKNQVDFIYLHQYLYYFYLSGKTDPLQRRSTGIRNLRFKEYKEIEIPLPPIEEQRRIVAVLDEAMAGVQTAVANTKRNLENGRELFTSFLQQVLSESSSNWHKASLSESCNFSQGIQVGVENQYTQKGKDQVRFLRIIDFTQGEIPERFIDDPGEKYWMTISDVALVRYGASTGFVCTGYEGVIANNLFKVIPKNDTITKEYLYWFLKSTLFQNEIQRRMNGAAMPAISFGMINDIEMRYPPIHEQRTIVAQLDDLATQTQQLEAIYEQKLAALSELKQSILQQAFSGALSMS